MIVRVSTWQTPTEPKARASVRRYITDEVLPALKTVFGRQRGRWLYDEKDASLVVVTDWRSLAAMERSAPLMEQVKREGERRGLTYLTGQTYEMLLEG